MKNIFKERKNYKPFEYSHITDPLINAMWAGHWTHNEFTFKNDVQDYHTKLTDVEKEVVKKALLLISQVEVAVKSYWSNIGKVLPKPEIGDMGAVFGGIEVIHSRAYSEVLNKLGFNDDFQAILTEGVVKNRVTYLSKYVNKIYKNDHKNICYSLILFTIFTENISLFSQFYTILGFNRFNNVLKDTANIVQYTSKEENLHALGGMALINEIRKEFPELFDSELEERIKSEAIEAYEAEKGLIEWILGGYENDFLSQDILETYLKRRFNESLIQIDMSPIFEIDQKIAEKTLWMDEEVYADVMTDFFYKKPIEYQKKMTSYNTDDLF